MVLLRPVEDGLQNIFGAHLPLAGHIVAAGGAVGCGAVLVYPVEIPGHGPLEPGVQRVGVVVHHIHDDPEALGVEGPDHLLQLPDAHFPPGGVCGVRSLRHIVVHRVIAPVEIRPLAGLIHRTVIVDRHQLDVIHPQLLQIGNTGGMHAVPVQGCVRVEKRRVFPPGLFRKSAGSVPGKLLHMELVDDRLLLQGRRPVLLPALRVRLLKVHNHAALPVDPAGPCIGISRKNRTPLHLQSKIIINPV